MVGSPTRDDASGQISNDEFQMMLADKSIKSLYAQVNVPGTGTFGAISAKFVLSTRQKQHRV